MAEVPDAVPAVPDELVQFASRLADAAGAAIRPHFRVAGSVESKVSHGLQLQSIRRIPTAAVS